MKTINATKIVTFKHYKFKAEFKDFLFAKNFNEKDLVIAYENGMPVKHFAFILDKKRKDIRKTYPLCENVFEQCLELDAEQQHLMYEFESFDVEKSQGHFDISNKSFDYVLVKDGKVYLTAFEAVKMRKARDYQPYIVRELNKNESELPVFVFFPTYLVYSIQGYTIFENKEAIDKAIDKFKEKYHQIFKEEFEKYVGCTFEYFMLLNFERKYDVQKYEEYKLYIKKVKKFKIDLKLKNFK